MKPFVDSRKAINANSAAISRLASGGGGGGGGVGPGPAHFMNYSPLSYPVVERPVRTAWCRIGGRPTVPPISLLPSGQEHDELLAGQV